MRQAAFELVFLLVILKIPVAYMCFVIWWAWRAEPRPLEGAALAVTPESPPPRSPRRPRRQPRRGPHGGPVRSAPRGATARAYARR